MGTLQYGVISQNISFLTEPSMAERLKTGSLNMLLGMGTVFLVLTLIICFISLLKIIPYLQGRKSGKANDTSSTVDHVIAQIALQEEEELNGDCELVAVITAAIYASMGEDYVPADSFVVRSIRRVNSRRWMNA